VSGSGQRARTDDRGAQTAALKAAIILASRVGYNVGCGFGCAEIFLETQTWTDLS
jgi:hypothetical protein